LPNEDAWCRSTRRRLSEEIFVFGYRVIYTDSDSTVLIVAVLHGARDVAGWLRRRGPATP
jgi:plasmid stabilization system protein ParE